MYKNKYSQAKRQFTGSILKSKLKRIRMKYNSAKRAKKMYDLEYKQMKEQMDSNSPPTLDGSLSDDSSSSNCNKNSSSSSDND